jgi:hypothetical protein
LGFTFRKTSVQDPFCIIAEIEYHEGKRTHGTEHWKTVAASIETTEEQTYTYLFSEDSQRLYSFERYSSQSFLKDVHAPSEAIQQNIAKQKDLRCGLRLHFLTQLYVKGLDDQ